MHPVPDRLIAEGCGRLCNLAFVMRELQVEIAFTGDDGFVAEVLVPEASFPGLSRIPGRYRVADGHIASAVLLPPMT